MRRIKELPPSTRPAHFSRKYDWDTICDGSAWELTQGEDYTCKGASFRTNVMVQAKKRGGKAETRLFPATATEPERFCVKVIYAAQKPVMLASHPSMSARVSVAEG